MKNSTKNTIIPLVLLVILIVGKQNILAQGPFTFHSTIQKTKLATIGAPGTELTMTSNAFSKDGNVDGLLISASFAFDAISESIDSKLLLFKFTNSKNDVYLEVFYHKGTIVLRRYFKEGNYDYLLYDRLYKKTDMQATGKWDVNLYFTPSFIWAEATHHLGTDPTPYFLSPILFGLDTYNTNYIAGILNSDDNYHFTLGSESNPYNFMVLEGATFYSFKYNDLKDDVLKNFSQMRDKPAGNVLKSTTTPLEEVVSDPFLRVYPNPVTDVLNIEYSLDKDAAISVQLYSLMGSLIKSTGKQKVSAGTHVQYLNCADLSPGTYILKVVAGEKVLSEKVIKK